eukprot:4888636-Amphidinium_carterae.1
MHAFRGPPEVYQIPRNVGTMGTQWPAWKSACLKRWQCSLAELNLPPTLRLEEVGLEDQLLCHTSPNTTLQGKLLLLTGTQAEEQLKQLEVVCLHLLAWVLRRSLKCDDRRRAVFPFAFSS